MFALVLLAVGFFTRASAIVAWVLAMSFHHRAITVLNGGDDVAVQTFVLSDDCAGRARRGRSTRCDGE